MLNIFNQQNKDKIVKKNGKVPSPKKKKAGFEDYVDTSESLSSKTLGHALWYVKHKVLLYRMLVIGLVVFSVFTFGFSVWKIGDYLIFGVAGDKELSFQAGSFIDYTGIHPRYTPTPFNVGQVLALPGGVGRYDAYADVINPNSDWRVGFSYHFVIDGVATARETAFILPGEQRPVATLGIERKTAPRSLEIIIENVEWNRVSPHQVVNVESWQTARLQFKATNFTFLDATRAGGGANVITFTISNPSSYGYKHPEFLVGLKAGRQLLGLMPLQLNDLKSQATSFVDLRSFVTPLIIDGVELFPLIDIYDPEVYLPPDE